MSKFKEQLRTETAAKIDELIGANLLTYIKGGIRLHTLQGSLSINDNGHLIYAIGDHFVHVGIHDGELRITIYDHCEITVKGERKATPTIIIDSDEYPTHLSVQQSERHWESFADNRARSRLAQGV